MQTETFMQMLTTEDFKMDAQGRLVLTNDDLMREINGASAMFEMMVSNGACINASC